MEATTIQKFMHTTPRKLRLVADMVRAMEPAQAVETLKFTHKAAALDLLKAIETAVANSKQKGLEVVSFKAIEINEGPKMRRFMAGTRGRVKPYKRRMAHIKIVLTDDVQVKSEKSKVKSTSQKLKVNKNEKTSKDVILNASEGSSESEISNPAMEDSPDSSSLQNDENAEKETK